MSDHVYLNLFLWSIDDPQEEAGSCNTLLLREAGGIVCNDCSRAHGDAGHADHRIVMRVVSPENLQRQPSTRPDETTQLLM